MSNIRFDPESDLSGTFPGSTEFGSANTTAETSPKDPKPPFTTNKQWRDYYNNAPLADGSTELSPEEIRLGLTQIANIRRQHGWPERPSPVLQQLEDAALTGQVEL